ncbi:PREDICTED: glycogen debranching enzyme-like, partial [Acropora digitifera]|uniref:glycogen debranching enzyme-like n=1 Tax=Acropora digitifera TaxID=70779 RepID=UPI00077B0B84
LFDGIRLDNCHSTPLHVAESPTEALNAHDPHEEGRLIYRYGGEPVGAFMHPSDVKPLVPSIAHALFMDVTHDNPSPFQVRSVYDAMASSALVAMACCATGSSRGYDELVPHHIHVVKEDRLYQSWPDKSSKLKSNAFVKDNDGILSAKRAINELHRWLGEQGYSQICRAERKGDNTFEVHFHNFAPGSVVAFDITMENRVKNSLGQLRQLAVDMYGKRSESPESYSKIDELDGIIGNLSLCDLNRVLYRADPEERDDGNGGGVYVLPETGALVYCGLQGVISVLANVRQFNDLGHPLCRNLRDGDWLMDYTVSRLLPFVGTRQLGVWLDKAFGLVKELPRYLVPCYFDAIITPLYLRLLERAWAQMSSTVKEGSSFLKALSLGSLQFVGLSTSASLPVLSPKLYHGSSSGASMPTLMSLAAGLPHFSTGFMRCWGRDTFIALKGLLLVTGRYQDARNHILGYAACVRHGLVPNLLDGGRKPRFNCRDASWWWLQCVQDYCSIVPNGLKILSDPVSRIFPSDSSQPQAPGKHVGVDLSDKQFYTESSNLVLLVCLFSDWAYEGVYDNSQESSSYKSAKGFSYHQGPEWLWCLGPFLRARLYFSKKLYGREGLEETVVRVKKILARHKTEITSSPWRSLPELTNAGGSPCYDGCPAQAWSVACLIDVLYDMEALLKAD